VNGLLCADVPLRNYSLTYIVNYQTFNLLPDNSLHCRQQLLLRPTIIPRYQHNAVAST